MGEIREGSFLLKLTRYSSQLQFLVDFEVLVFVVVGLVSPQWQPLVCFLDCLLVELVVLAIFVLLSRQIACWF